jgi:hypothetical protein
MVGAGIPAQWEKAHLYVVVSCSCILLMKIDRCRLASFRVFRDTSNDIPAVKKSKAEPPPILGNASIEYFQNSNKQVLCSFQESPG